MIENEDLDRKHEMLIFSVFHIVSSYPIKLSPPEDMSSKIEEMMP
jgi:hypothetical protein